MCGATAVDVIDFEEFDVPFAATCTDWRVSFKDEATEFGPLRRLTYPGFRSDLISVAGAVSLPFFLSLLWV
jgi:hypothetical protein